MLARDPLLIMLALDVVSPGPDNACARSTSPICRATVLYHLARGGHKRQLVWRLRVFAQTICSPFPPLGLSLSP